MNSSDDMRHAPQGVAKPPGVLPKNINVYVLGVIALLVLSASFCSGKKASKTQTTQNDTTGPSPDQLKTFQQMLDKATRDAAKAKRQFDENALREKQVQAPTAVPSSTGSREIDPLLEERRKRAAKAPFAKNVAFRAPDIEEAPISRASQVAFHVEEEEEKDKQATEPTRATPEAGPKESGMLLNPKEGDLFRLYEGTTIETTLANRLDGSFTGPILSVVAKDVHSKDGSSTVLIPVGSKFLGSASKVTVQNQVRLAVTFDRLLLPNGYSIALDDAPGLDRAGETGLKDKVDNHRLRRFGISGAIGILSGIAQFVTRGALFASAPINTTGSAVTRDLNDYLNALPTITIREGHAVIVFLPTDLLLPEYIPLKKGTR